MADMTAKTYALTDSSGRIFELFKTAPGVPIEEMLHPDLIKGAIDVTGQGSVAVGMVKSGSGFSTPPAPAARLDGKAAGRIAAGLTVLSKNHPDASGTYPLDPASLMIMTALARSAEANPAGKVRVYDINGEPKLLTQSQLVELIAAAEDRHDKLRAVARGQSTAMPSDAPAIIS